MIQKDLLGKKVVAVRTDSKTEITAIYLEGNVKILTLDGMVSKKNLNEEIGVWGDMDGIKFHLLGPGE